MCGPVSGAAKVAAPMAVRVGLTPGRLQAVRIVTIAARAVSPERTAALGEK